MNNAVSYAARELGSLIRAHLAGQSVDEMTVADAVERMLSAPVQSTADLMALISVAHTLTFNAVANSEGAADSAESVGLAFALCLLEKATNVLQAETGIRSDDFTGQGPALH